MQPAELLVGGGEHAAVLTDGTAHLHGAEQSWSTVGLYRFRDSRIAAYWLLRSTQGSLTGSGRKSPRRPHVEVQPTPAVPRRSPPSSPAQGSATRGHAIGFKSRADDSRRDLRHDRPSLPRFPPPDPRIALAIWTALGDASSVVNVGAGTGSYEPDDRELIAVEPSAVMISQGRPAPLRRSRRRPRRYPLKIRPSTPRWPCSRSSTGRASNRVSARCCGSLGGESCW
jgi:hypothetical protein